MRSCHRLGTFVDGGTGGYPEVANYTALPAAASVPNEIYVVLNAEGIFLLTRKRAGLWYSDGASWKRLGDALQFFNDANFTIFNDGDNSKEIDFDASGITGGNTRTITMPDSNVDLGLVGVDNNVKVSSNDTTTGYLEDKIVVSEGSNSTNILEKSTLNDGADEDVQIQIDETKIDHDLLKNFASNEHFTEASIDHTNILNIGTNTHAQIDTHIISNGSDHTFIDQDVTITGTPIFAQATIDNIVINANLITTSSGDLDLDSANNVIEIQGSTHLQFGLATNYIAAENDNRLSLYASDNGAPGHIRFHIDTVLKGYFDDDGLVIGSGEVGKDYRIAFDSDTNPNGILKWHESEQYFSLGELYFLSSNKIYFRTTDNFIHSPSIGDITIDADDVLNAYGATLTNVGVDGNISLFGSTLRVIGPAQDGKADLATDSIRFNNAYLNGLIKAPGGVYTKVSYDNTSNPPTDAELDTAFGAAASNEGLIGLLDDNSADTNVYLCIPNDTSWWYCTLTKAV